MTMLAEIVDVVIGVDTHKHTHTAGVILSGTGAVTSRPRPAISARRASGSSSWTVRTVPLAATAPSQIPSTRIARLAKR